MERKHKDIDEWFGCLEYNILKVIFNYNDIVFERPNRKEAFLLYCHDCWNSFDINEKERYRNKFENFTA